MSGFPVVTRTFLIRALVLGEFWRSILEADLAYDWEVRRVCRRRGVTAGRARFLLGPRKRWRFWGMIRAILRQYPEVAGRVGMYWSLTQHIGDHMLHSTLVSLRGVPDTHMPRDVMWIHVECEDASPIHDLFLLYIMPRLVYDLDA